MKTKILLAGAALACMFAAAPAAAKPADWRGCDGFRAPTRTADGMQRRAQPMFTQMLDIIGASIGRRVDSGFAAAGLAACEGALADPLLLPTYTLRRASLLRARGIYRLAAGEHEAALADFALSDQAAAPVGDLYYDRSLGLGTALMRSYAHHLAGRKDEAVAGARAVIAARPTDPELSAAAADIILAATGDWDVYTATLRGIAAYDPTVLMSLYPIAAVRGRFEEAAAIQPQIVLTVPSQRGGNLVGGRSPIVVGNFLTQIELDGSAAFALAATGQKARAEAGLRALADRVEADLTRPELPPGVTDRSTIRRELNRFEQLSPRAEEARTRVAFWRTLVDLRLMAAHGRAAEAATRVRTERIGQGIYALNIYEAVAAAHPASRAELEPLIAAARQAVDQSLARIAETDLSELGRRLPEAELATRVPAYEGGSDGILGNDGFMSRAASIPGARTVKFQSDEGTAATNAEMALLRAAELARERNMAGFIILDRRVLQRTLVTRQYGAVIDTDHEGYIAELDVVFVNPDALPAGLEGAGWRFVDAEAVRSRLDPVYRRRPAAPANRRNRT